MDYILFNKIFTLFIKKIKYFFLLLMEWNWCLNVEKQQAVAAELTIKNENIENDE